MSDGLYWMSDQQLAAALDDAKALGVGWVRTDLRWDWVQPQSASSYSWGNFDRVVDAVQSRSLSLLVILDYTPEWARPAGWTEYPYWAPADPAQFATFAAAAARRYAPLGVHTWEIWNEENGNFGNPQPDPAAYVELLKLTAAGIRNVDPQAFIVSGGLSWCRTDSTHISALEFFASICALGANRVVDAIGYHPYTFPLTPQNPDAWQWAQIATTNPSFRTILAEYGTPSLPIWVTEYGAPTGGPGIAATTQGYPPGTRPDHVDEAFQAELVTDSIRAALDTPGVSALFLYSDRDYGTDPSSTENFFGLRRFDGTLKPAFYAMQSAINQWVNATPTPTPAPTPTPTPTVTSTPTPMPTPTPIPTRTATPGDTVGPAFAAKNVTVKHDKTCRIYFSVYDSRSAQVTVQLTITTKSRVVKKRWSWGYDKNLNGWWWMKYTCRLRRGTYRITVTGRDLTGNRARVVGRAKLVVK